MQWCNEKAEVGEVGQRKGGMRFVQPATATRRVDLNVERSVWDVWERRVGRTLREEGLATRTECSQGKIRL